MHVQLKAALTTLFTALLLIAPTGHTDTRPAWRKAVVIPETDRYGSPIVADVAMGPNAEVYVIWEGGLAQLKDNRFRRFGGPRIGTTRRNAERNEYLIQVKAGDWRPEDPKTKLKIVATRPEQAVNGILRQLSVTAAGDIWVAAADGFVYTRHDKVWRPEKVRGDKIFVSPDGRTAVTWSEDPVFGSHKEWLKKRPHPFLKQDGEWQPQPALSNVRSVAFDEQSRPMALIFDTQSRDYQLLQRRDGRWVSISAPQNIKSIQSDTAGNIIALTYASERVKDVGWVYSNERIHHWRDGQWQEDLSLPDLHTNLRLDKLHHGKLITYEDRPTWVARQTWLWLQDIEVAEQTPPLAEPVIAALVAADSTWYGRIQVIDPAIAINPVLKANWADGAYLHLRPDGKLGLNWDEAASYEYDPANGWMQDGDTMVLRFGLFMYAFEMTSPYDSGNTTLGTAFSMTIERP